MQVLCQTRHVLTESVMGVFCLVFWHFQTRGLLEKMNKHHTLGGKPNPKCTELVHKFCYGHLFIKIAPIQGQF